MAVWRSERGPSLTYCACSVRIDCVKVSWGVRLNET